MKTLKTTNILLYTLAGIMMTIALTVLAGNENTMKKNTSSSSTINNYNEGQFKKAYFAGGCFWCVESNYEKVEGVIEVISGYSGGHIKNPGYKQVSSGSTGHVEAVEVIYDSSKVSYNDLLTELWHLIDPTDATGSFVDRGLHYRSVIFYTNKEEKALAEQSIRELAQSGRYSKNIATEVIPF
ncbi:MAG: peptide-methionine (S)-S-oxide reductase MsrA, partial [Thiotrichaceae bacterium]|nr:peptide-methionine (S)-S-oxide reductase MsrA [Thiotrichaceae bacterium]